MAKALVFETREEGSKPSSGTNLRRMLLGITSTNIHGVNSVMAPHFSSDLVGIIHVGSHLLGPLCSTVCQGAFLWQLNLGADPAKLAE